MRSVDTPEENRGYTETETKTKNQNHIIKNLKKEIKRSKKN